MNCQIGPSRSFYLTYFSMYLSEYLMGYSNLNLYALRLFYSFTIGFLNRKQNLILNFRPKHSVSINLNKTVKWIQKNFINEKFEKNLPLSFIQEKANLNILRMG